MNRTATLALGIALIVLSCPTFGQVPTGTPPFGSFGGGPFDTVNLGSLNVHFAIPVVHKGGRGIPFTYDLGYDTSVWYPLSVNGTQTWEPVQNWGWHAQTEVATGYVSYSITSSPCGYPHPTGWFTHYTNFVYHDTFGTSHSFIGTAGSATGSCATTQPLTTTATDGSGYVLDFLVSGYSSPTLFPKGGGSFVPPVGGITSGAASVTDANGNKISVSSGGVFTDTLNTQALAISGSGTPSSPIQLTYTGPSNTQPVVQINYGQYNIQTNFGCSGIGEYAANGVYLVNSISMPDGSSYSFSYEQNGSYYTGRLKTVTLPTGGVITYNYTGANGGVSCSDGSTIGLTRTLSPGGQWSYTRTQVSGNHWQTKVTTPPDSQNPGSVGDDTVIDFARDSATGSTNNFYETQRQTYQGSSSSGTILSTAYTCYNGFSVNAPANCATTAVSTPIAQVAAFNALPSGQEAETDSIYLGGGLGLIHEVDAYDYGSGAVGPLLRKTIIAYASLGSGIVDRPSSVTIEDGNSNIKAYTSYAYDETGVTATSGTPQHVSVTGSRGNVTTVSKEANSTTTLSKHFTYYDTGTLNTSTDVNGASTTYTYASGSASCYNSFATSISEPLSLSRSMTWDCNGGVPTQMIDENNQPTSLSYSGDPYWRLTNSTDPTGAATAFAYQPTPTYQFPPMVQASMSFGSSTVNVLNYGDGFGRTYTSQRLQAPNATTLDTVSYTYDSFGRLSSTSMPCATGYTNTCSTPQTTQTYDALGRPLLTTDGGGGTMARSYTKNDVLVTIGPAPSGEHVKQKQYEYDGLGRLKSVCEVTTSSGSGTCGQSSPQSGYWTQYTYDALDDLTQVVQNAQGSPTQTRTYTYDMLGRLTSEANPESGTKQYFYDSSPATPGYSCQTAAAGDVAKTYDANGNTLCYQHDTLHRLIESFASGPNNDGQAKYFVFDAATVNGTAMVNSKGRLAEAYTATCQSCSKITDEGFSYTARGERSDVYESVPNSGGYHHMNETYWPHGLPLTVTGDSMTGGYAYSNSTLDGEGRLASGADLVSGVSYNVAGEVTGISYANGDSDSYGYDPQTGRMTQYAFNVYGVSDQQTLTWNQNGTLGQLAIVDGLSSADNQTCGYQYDDLTRLASANCGSAWSQSFSYDPFGNITKSGSSSWMPNYNNATNQYQTGWNGVSYDLNGDITNDTFYPYSWNEYGRLTQVGSATPTYDAFDRLVAYSNGSGNFQLIYAPDGYMTDLMQGGSNAYMQFVPLPNGNTGVWGGSGIRIRRADWLGSSRMSSSWSPPSTYVDSALAPFGEDYAHYAPSGDGGDYSFTGQNQYFASGVYNFPLRDYHATQGRWLTPDPAGMAAVDPTNPQTWNRYAYVGNNPLSFVDPLGLRTCPPGSEDNCIDVTATAPGPSVDDSGIGSLGGGEVDAMRVPMHLTFRAPPGGGLGSGLARVTSKVKSLVRNYCSKLPDVSQVAAGGDLALAYGVGGAATLSANGKSGEFSLSVSGGPDTGAIGPDAYVGVGVVRKAPTNESLQGFTDTVSIAGARNGVQVDITGNNIMATYGPSYSPVTANFQLTGTKNLVTVPLVGYLLNSDKAICTALGW